MLGLFYQVLILLSGGYPVSGVADAIVSKLASDAVYEEPVADILTSGIEAIKYPPVYVGIE